MRPRDTKNEAEIPSSWANLGPANTRKPTASTLETSPAPPPPEAPKGRTTLGLGLVSALVLGAALVGGIAGGALVVLLADDDSEGQADGEQTLQSLTVEQTAAISQAAADTRPSVVRIESTRRAASGATEQDIGSGVVLDNEGHVITNAHVVLNTDTLKIVLPDGTERPAILVGHDYPFTDLAVLQIGPGNLKPIELGDSEALRLGEAVVAVGNPLAEFDGSITVGVVSGLSRVRTLDGVRQDDLIQTDAAVNNGNSGGALVNLHGQFIGMPTAIIRQSRSGQPVEGIAFALPANRVLEIARTIIETGTGYPRPSIQAEHVDLTPEVLAKIPKPGAKEGALVSIVAPGGAAAEAGIQAGDIISRVGDQDVNLEHPLFNVIMTYKAGDSAKFVLNRNGRIIETEVRFAQRS